MFALSRNAQHLSLLFDDRPHQVGHVSIALRTLLQLRRFQRDLDDAHLIRYQAEDACELGAISPRYALQAKIAGKWVQIRELRPGLPLFDVKCQETWDLPHQLKRVVTIEEAAGMRFVGNREESGWMVPHPFGNLRALGCYQSG